MQHLIPKVWCDLAQLDLLNELLDYKRFLEALNYKSEAGFEVSLKERVYLMVQTIFDDMFDEILISSFSSVTSTDYR